NGIGAAVADAATTSNAADRIERLKIMRLLVNAVFISAEDAPAASICQRGRTRLFHELQRNRLRNEVEFMGCPEELFHASPPALSKIQCQFVNVHTDEFISHFHFHPAAPLHRVYHRLTAILRVQRKLNGSLQDAIELRAHVAA